MIVVGIVSSSYVYAGKMPKEPLASKQPGYEIQRASHELRPTSVELPHVTVKPEFKERNKSSEVEISTSDSAFFAKQKEDRQKELSSVAGMGSVKKIIEPQSEKDAKSRARLDEAADIKKYVGKIEPEVFVEEQKTGRGTLSPKETMIAWKAEDEEKARAQAIEAKRVQTQKERLLALDKQRAELIKNDPEYQPEKVINNSKDVLSRFQQGYELEKKAIINSKEKSAADKELELQRLDANMAKLIAEKSDKKPSIKEKTTKEVQNIIKEIEAVRELPGVVSPKEGARLMTKAADLKQTYDRKIKVIENSKVSPETKESRKNAAAEKYLQDLVAFKEKTQALQTKVEDQKKRSNEILNKTDIALGAIEKVRDAGLLLPKDVRTLSKTLVSLRQGHNKEVASIAKSKNTAEEKVYQRKLADEKFISNLETFTKRVEDGDPSLFQKKKTSKLSVLKSKKNKN